MTEADLIIKRWIERKTGVPTWKREMERLSYKFQVIGKVLNTLMDTFLGKGEK